MLGLQAFRCIFQSGYKTGFALNRRGQLMRHGSISISPHMKNIKNISLILKAFPPEDFCPGITNFFRGVGIYARSVNPWLRPSGSVIFFLHSLLVNRWHKTTEADILWNIYSLGVLYFQFVSIVNYFLKRVISCMRVSYIFCYFWLACFESSSCLFDTSANAGYIALCASVNQSSTVSIEMGVMEISGGCIVLMVHVVYLLESREETETMLRCIFLNALDRTSRNPRISKKN